MTDGVSFLPTLLGKNQRETHEYLYWEIPEYGGQQAVRIGNYKAIRKNIFEGNLEVELYDLSSDIQESQNLADQYPEIIKQVEGILEREHVSSEIQRFRYNIY
jgi:arylsulfatase